MIRVTIVVPWQYKDPANQLASCLGYVEEEGLTFSLCPCYEDKDKNLYLMASLVTEEDFVVDAVSDLVVPEWEVDMEAALFAQSKVVLKELSSLVEGDLDENVILAVLGEDVEMVKNILNLKEQ